MIELEKAQELIKAHLSKKKHLIILKEIQTDYLKPQSISEW
jgi:ribosomal protein L25 (general stress protein Ctc)